MNDKDRKLFSLLNEFLNGEIDFWELDRLWIEIYIEDDDEPFYQDLFFEISEYIYMGQKDEPTKDEIKDGIIGQRQLKIKIKDEINKYPDLCA